MKITPENSHYKNQNLNQEREGTTNFKLNEEAEEENPNFNRKLAAYTNGFEIRVNETAELDAYGKLNE